MTTTMTGYRHKDLHAVERDDVLRAIEECDEIGAQAFLEKHGYKPSRLYQLRFKGRSYPSKAILGVAAGLTWRNFFGGADKVVKHLTRLGFQVRDGSRVVTALGLLDLARQAKANGDLPETYEIPELVVEPTSCFASGSNRAAEIRGLASVAQDIGVAAPDVHESATEELVKLAGTDIQVFVDSGAFGEFTSKKTITHTAWLKRLTLYGRLATALTDQVWLVAPDKIGDQDETITRLEKYRDYLREFDAKGARILVAIQKGKMSQASFAWKIDGVLKGIRWLPALPCRKAATLPHEVAAFLAGRPQTEHVHLLGLGPRNPQVGAYLAPIAKAGCSVSLDSSWIRSNSENAPEKERAQINMFGMIAKGRRYTWAQEIAGKMLQGVKAFVGKARELAFLLSFGLSSVISTPDLDVD